jgi:hypothetical protein
MVFCQTRPKAVVPDCAANVLADKAFCLIYLDDILIKQNKFIPKISSQEWIWTEKTTQKQ